MKDELLNYQNSSLAEIFKKIEVEKISHFPINSEQFPELALPDILSPTFLYC